MKLNLLEASPPGFSGTVSKMKKKMPESKAFALAWGMYNRGAKPHVKPEKNPKGVKNYVKPSKYRKRRRKRISEAYDWSKPMTDVSYTVYNYVTSPGEILDEIIAKVEHILYQGYKAVAFEFDGKKYYIDKPRLEQWKNTKYDMFVAPPPNRKEHLGSRF